MQLKDLAVDHPYYCSDSNYYKDITLIYQSMSDFLDDFETADIDMNLCFRWDVLYDKGGKCSAEIFLMLQRKGIFQPCVVNNFEPESLERFVDYLKRHKKTLMEMWEPL